MVEVSVVVVGVDAAELVVTRVVWDFLDLEVFDDVSTAVDGETIVVWKEEAVLEDVVRASVTVVRIVVIFEPILVWKLVVRAFVVCATVVVIDTVEVEALVDVSTAVVG